MRYNRRKFRGEENCMDIYQLKYFISAASIGNFTLAALENNISQSSLSKQIMNLESELGTQLFVRTRRHVTLTPAGEQFQEYAHRMLSTYEEMLRGMESFSRFQTLPVSIASIPVIQAYQLGDLIFRLRNRYPEIFFSVTECPESPEVLHLLHKRECDFAILRTDFLEKEKYNIYPIIKDRMAAVLPADHPLADGREEISLRELKDEKFVMAPERADLRMISLNACIAHGFRPEIAYITSGNIDLTLDAVERQGMVYLAFEKVIRYHAKGRQNCRILRLKESIESCTAFVSIRSCAATKSHEKVVSFLQEEYAIHADE